MKVCSEESIAIEVETIITDVDELVWRISNYFRKQRKDCKILNKGYMPKIEVCGKRYNGIQKSSVRPIGRENIIELVPCKE